MTVPHFVDSNVLIYAAMARRSEPEKFQKATDLISVGPFGISGQVLAEFYANVIKKAARPLSPLQALEWVERLSLQPCVDVTPALVKNGIRVSQRYQISYWDGAIIAAAEALGAPLLYTEDLNHGQTYGSVRVENPFHDL